MLSKPMRETNLRVYGNAPYRVAVFHGGPGAAGEMASVARRLAAQRGVLEPMQTAMSVDGQVEELSDALAEHARPPVVLIGYSWGAWLSIFVASRFPDLVSKLILVSSPAFRESYVAQLHARRLSRLDERERAELQALITNLGNCEASDKDRLLAKLGALVSKSDSYAPAEDADQAGTVNVDGEIYQRVWTEAAEMRRSGELLLLAGNVRCPVVAIHGDHDPSPADGVSEPLSDVLRDFRFVLLGRCGHTPWNERYAREEFYRVVISELEQR